MRSQARLAHPIDGEVLREAHAPLSPAQDLPDPGRGGGRHGHAPAEDLLHVGRWLLEGGAEREPVVLTEAARRARQMFDVDLAARLARAAFDSGGGVPAGIVLGETEFSSDASPRRRRSWRG